MEEIWKEIKGYEGLYEVSNFGNVRSLDRYVHTKGNGLRLHRGKILTPETNKLGYKRLHASKDGVSKHLLVHRLVAEAFLPNYNNYPVVNHKDENPSNNHVSNLEWCTYSYNNQYNNLTTKRFLTRTENMLNKNLNLGHEIILLDKNYNIIKTYHNAEWAKREDGLEQSGIRAAVRRNNMVTYKNMYYMQKSEYDFITSQVQEQYVKDFLKIYLVKGNKLIKNIDKQEIHILHYAPHYFYKIKPIYEDLRDKTFGMLKVVRQDFDHTYPDGKHRRKWWCLCDCGNPKLISVFENRLKNESTKSCGCLRVETLKNMRLKHGDSNTKLYYIWGGIKSRCLNKNNKDYHSYGGRDIKICNQWIDNYMAFKEWALSHGYQEGLSIERIDVNGDYCPENCCWITMSEQQYNKR
jgi:hypothetical protein